MGRFPSVLLYVILLNWASAVTGAGIVVVDALTENARVHARMVH